jgi:hypothetical protein
MEASQPRLERGFFLAGVCSGNRRSCGLGQIELHNATHWKVKQAEAKAKQ